MEDIVHGALPNELMDKYGLSSRQLEKLLTQLMEKGLLKRIDLPFEYRAFLSGDAQALKASSPDLAESSQYFDRQGGFSHVEGNRGGRLPNVAAKAMIAYNSGKTARIMVFPNTSFPEPIAAIPLDVTPPCLMAENSPTNPNASPAASMAMPCHN